MKLKVYDQKAKELETVTVSDKLIPEKSKASILSQYVFVYLSNQRQSNAHTKDRSEVAGSRRKPWKQKGTGRARSGTKQSPLWRGGGVTFGPSNEANWKKRLNKKFRAAAVRNALSNLNNSKKLSIVDSFAIDTKKALSRQIIDLQKSFNIDKKVLLITNEVNKNLVNATNNIENTHVVFVKDVNAYDLINAGTLLIEKEAIQYMDAQWGDKK